MPAAADAFATLGQDLILLSIRPGDGKLLTWRRIDYGLMASELVRLTAIGRIDIIADQIVVRDRARTGDPELDSALRSLTGLLDPLRPVTWVSLPRRGIRYAYLDRLVAEGVLVAEPSTVLGTRRYRITGVARAAAARARLDAIAQSSGQQVEVAEAAFGALASAIGLDRVLYRGSAGRPLRARLAQLTAGQRAARAARTSGSGVPGAGVDGAADVIAQAAAAASSAAGQPGQDAVAHHAGGYADGAHTAAGHVGHAGGAVGGHYGHH